MMFSLSGVSIPDAGEAFSDTAVWETFIHADSAEARCRSWLKLACGHLPDVEAAAILVEHPVEHTFAPIAVWPEVNPEMARLGPVIEKVLRERRSVTQVTSTPSVVTHVAWPLLAGERIVGILAFAIARPEREIEAIVRQIHWGCAWIANLFLERDRASAEQGQKHLGAVLEATAVMLRHRTLRQALFAVVHTLRQQFDASRVAIGLADEESATVMLVALSDAATFERRAPLVKAYEQAMHEAYDVHLAVLSPPLESQEDRAAALAPLHAELRAISGAEATLSYPLTIGARCVGVMTLDKKSGTFGQDALAWLDAFSALAAPVIEQRRAAERGVWSRFSRDCKRVFARLFGPRHLTWKVATCSVLLLAAVLALTPIHYRVSAKTVVEGEVQRVAAAPFEGFIRAAHVRAGDVVKASQPLAELDDRTLRIEEARWSSEKDQYTNRLREAMANNDLVSLQVLDAQVRQAEAQLALTTERIARARLVAPFDGVVVSGDLSQQIGAPVEMGQILFEIAPLQSYRVILQVDEREIRHVRVGQSGRLVMTGIAGEAMDFKVARVTPVATAEEGKNFFRVEAALSGAPLRLRPGMEGIGKIEVGRHSLWWVLTHSLTEWLTLFAWTWLP
ncbi:MAG: HlyD family efflux transporter periplasmic adaptor subunit [Zoogloeaceae bacterium]|jgi:hypothetical protein|nr:HlyD family efflux transporter periplasmic adaptor subunit [Zoogloeaceae bacterium]